MTLDEKLAALFPDVDSNTMLIYRCMADDAIKYYMNIDPTTTSDTIESTYESAVLQLISNKIKFDDMDGIKACTVSSTSVTYADNKGLSVTDDVKALLPRPYVRLLG